MWILRPEWNRVNPELMNVYNGRWLCEIFLPGDIQSLNQTMLEAGLVESYLP